MGQINRSRIALVLILWGVAAIGWSLTRIELPDSAPPAEATVRWVRTVDGWEKSTWHRPPPATPTSVHPALLSTFVALASLVGLFGFPSAEERAHAARATSSMRRPD